MQKPINLKKKKIKEVKLSREWCGWMIDLAAGSHLVMLGMRSPEAAEALQKIMIDYLRDTRTLEKYKNNSELFIADSMQNLGNLYYTFVTTKLKIYLKDGCPHISRIIQPGNGRMS